MRQILAIAIITFTIFNVQAQNCFTVIWTGNGLDHMNFYVSSATINGVNLQPGDEIGIFDGEDCVGAGVLTEELINNAYLPIVVSKDDPDTPEKDGYTLDNTASFKFCINNGTEVINDVQANYVTGTGVLSPGGTAMVELFCGTTSLINTSSNPPEGGTTSGSGAYDNGADVTVTATPATCYQFVNWTENGTVVSLEASYTFTASGDRNLVANFELLQYIVTTSSNPAQGGTTTGDGIYGCGEEVTVIAYPEGNYNFTNWTVDGSVVSTNESYSFTTSEDFDLVANFCTLPAQPSPISGETDVIPGQSYTYSVDPVPGATSYTWTLPSGWPGTSTTTSINAIAGDNGGTISVTANNDCGSSVARILIVYTCTPPAQPGPISGETDVIPWHSYTYSVDPVSAATSYTWALPSGWSGTSTTTSINATAGDNGGTISVTANNDCGSSEACTLNVYIGNLPTVFTSIINNIAIASATAGGEVTSDGGAYVTERGVCWTTSASPTTADNTTIDGGGTGAFTSDLTGLSSGTTYYVRAYATNSVGTAYGEERSFTTKNSNAITDIEGNYYNIVQICDQWWMAENLAYLPTVSPSSEGSQTDPYYYVYEYEGYSVSEAKETNNYNTYGVLYNWPAAMNSCPDGWHLPSDDEWKQLEMCLGMSQEEADGMSWRGTDEGYKLKSESGWSADGNGNNESGFTALPGGFRIPDGIFANITISGYWWTSTPDAGDGTFIRILARGVNEVNRMTSTRENGHSVRCVKDEPYTISTSSNPQEGGTTTGGGTYNRGETCSLTATAETGYEFINWTERGTPVSTNQNFSFTVTRDRILVANFCALPAQPGPISGETEAIPGQTYTYSVNPVPGATYYTWTLPSGWSGTSTTTSINATAGDNGGTISVTANNDCGSSEARTLAVYTCSPPDQPGPISGETEVIPGQSYTYSVNPVPGATSYTWTLPSGWSGTSTTTSISTTAGDNGGTISVTSNNDCGSSEVRTLIVYTCTPPAQPGPISGETEVIPGQSYTYGVNQVPGATSYTWTLPSGWSGTSTSTSISTTAGDNGGTISVTANNDCGSSEARTLIVYTCNPPAQPGPISGETEVVPGQSYTYGVNQVPGATSYTWTLPSGWSGISTTTIINATAGDNGGTISVSANNDCGSSEARTLIVYICTPPAQPGPISGETEVIPGQTYTYSIDPVPGATSYTWTLPSGWSGTSTTTLINATAGINGDTISVTANNECGASEARTLTFYLCTIPLQPGSISGEVCVMPGQSYTYRVDPVPVATSYTWTLPSGWGGTSDTYSITATAGATGGSISVTSNNDCGESDASTLNINISTIPQITIKWGDVLICSNVDNMILSYQWYIGSSPIAGADGQYYVTSRQPGIYKVEIIDKNGCRAMSDEIEIVTSKSLLVYPNPAKNSFVLNIYDEPRGKVIIKIINDAGIEVMNLKTEKVDDEFLKEIPAENLDEGLYIIQVMVDQVHFYSSKIMIIK